MFAVTIKDLEVHLKNSNLLTEKSVICVEPLVQKEEAGKQTASALY